MNIPIQILIAIVVVIVLAAIGGALLLINSTPATARGIFSADAVKIHNADIGGIGIVYQINLSTNQPNYGLTYSLNNITLYFYKLGNFTKIAAAMGEMSMAIYSINKTSVVCTQSAYMYSSSQVQCQAVNPSAYYNSQINLSALSKLNVTMFNSITYLGDRTFGTRSCSMFYLPMNQSFFNRVLDIFYPLGNYGNLYGSASFEGNALACLDNQYGYPDNFTINLNTYSNLTGQSSAFVKMYGKETNFSTNNVSQKIFSIPIKFNINLATCGRNFVNVNVTSFMNTANNTARIMLKNYSYNYAYPGATGTKAATIDNTTTKFGNGMTFGKTYDINASLSTPLTSGGDYNTTVCLDSNCYNTYCYYYNFTPYVGPPNIPTPSPNNASSAMIITGNVPYQQVNSSLAFYSTAAASGYLPINAIVEKGYPFYLCAFGDHAGNQLPSNLSEDVGTADVYIRNQTGNACYANVTGTDYGGGSIAIAGVQNVTSYKAFLNETGFATTDLPLSYVVPQNATLIVIAAASSGSGINSAALPSGCVQQQNVFFRGTGAFVAVCTGEKPGTYNVSVGMNYGYGAIGAWVFSNSK
ncbi:MAG: hypothetical protein M1504_04330 [Candidatus Marsarchaeota archaeon]|nr:hypothetical protein [Candidatus Marsarchaeota archaeon]